MRVFFLTICCVLIPLKSFAITGAELLQMDRGFAQGYVLGVVDARVSIYQANDADQQKLLACVTKANLNARTLYEVVQNYINRNPKELTFPAMGAVIKVLNEMCL